MKSLLIALSIGLFASYPGRVDAPVTGQTQSQQLRRRSKSGKVVG